MNCPSCFAEIVGKFKFCPECGGSVSGVSGQSEEEALVGDVSLGDAQTMVGSQPEAPSLGDLRTLMGPGEAVVQAPAAGQALGSRYEVLEELGRGGFAVVMKARDTRLDRLVAIKRLLAEKMTDTAGKLTLERFRREARTVAALSHRNIVQVYDHDEDAEGPYIVMELVAGGTLREYVKQRGKLPVEEAVRLTKGIAQGLAAAHRKNLIHRDIKPANVLLAKEGEEWVPKIVDFGLARMGRESELSMTGYGMGTPWYMPPEQRRDAKGVNHTADIYALGKTMYELLTGDIPDNVDPTKIPPPPALAEVVFKCVRSNPEERYFSAEELVGALDRLTAAGAKPPAAVNPAAVASDSDCPQCGTANPPDVKYCESCGTGMTRLCPECSRENPLRRKFCGGCGTDVGLQLLVADATGRMMQHKQKREWSRVLKAGQEIVSGTTLPGAKGKSLLATAADLQAEAIASDLEKDRILQEDLPRLLAADDYQQTAAVLARWRELTPEAHHVPAERLVASVRQLERVSQVAFSSRRLTEAQQELSALTPPELFPEASGGEWANLFALAGKRWEALKNHIAEHLQASENRLAEAEDLLAAKQRAEAGRFLQRARAYRLEAWPQAEKLEQKLASLNKTVEGLCTRVDQALLAKKIRAAQSGIAELIELGETGEFLEKAKTRLKELERARTSSRIGKVLLLGVGVLVGAYHLPEIKLLLAKGKPAASEIGSASNPDRAQGASSPLPAGTSRVFRAGCTSFEMVWAPQGTFHMGARTQKEGGANYAYPPKDVTLTKGFWVGKFEVTQAQWQAVMKSNPAEVKGESLPVSRIAVREIDRFLDEINKGRFSGLFKLPTEAQWEYACRAGIAQAFSVRYDILADSTVMNCKGDVPYLVDGDDILKKYPTLRKDRDGNYNPIPKTPYLGKPVEVGCYPPNAWGIYDMHGNVAEICRDLWSDTNPQAVDPLQLSGDFYVVRGGHYNSSPGDCTSFIRNPYLIDVNSSRMLDYDAKASKIGFRLIKEE